MGKLLILTKYIFLIYGDDINEKRKHIHVTFAHRGFKNSCKIWIEPEIEIDNKKTGDFSEVELLEIKKLVIEYIDILTKQLDLFYNNESVKSIKL